jgi:hypothetical protein
MLFFAVMTKVAAQLVTDGPVTSQATLVARRTALIAQPTALKEAAAASTAPVPSDPGVVPPVGQATAWGCAAALAYLQTYAAKGFTMQCPGYTQGPEAMTA